MAKSEMDSKAEELFDEKLARLMDGYNGLLDYMQTLDLDIHGLGKLPRVDRERCISDVKTVLSKRFFKNFKLSLEGTRIDLSVERMRIDLEAKQASVPQSSEGKADCKPECYLIDPGDVVVVRTYFGFKGRPLSYPSEPHASKPYRAFDR